MRYCTSCLQPDTRPNTRFSVEGVCPACLYHATLEDVDWDERHKEIEEIVQFGRSHSSGGYDCIIGVSGGKDSTRQALFVKDKLKMNPLLVSLGPPPAQITPRGVSNISNLIEHGFDCITINPGQETWKQLMRLSFLKYINPFKSTELALFSSVPRLAIAHQVPLIWWGENSALQLGESSVMGKSGSDGNNLRRMNTLDGGDISWMIENGVKKSEILQYVYPSEEEIERAGIRITFLGYFWKDWSLIDNGNFSALRGLEIRSDKPEEIGDFVGVMALDEDWTPMNQMIKYLKYGFGRATDYVNEEMRRGRMDRETALDLVNRYDGTCAPRFIQSFCDFIGISNEEFWRIVDERGVNHNLFTRIGVGQYEPKFTVGVGL